MYICNIFYSFEGIRLAGILKKLKCFWSYHQDHPPVVLIELHKKMTYLPEDAFKNILEFADDRIEQKQRQLMRSIKIERDEYDEKFIYTTSNQKLLWIKEEEIMETYNDDVDEALYYWRCGSDELYNNINTNGRYNCRDGIMCALFWI